MQHALERPYTYAFRPYQPLFVPATARYDIGRLAQGASPYAILGNSKMGSFYWIRSGFRWLDERML